jgi:hypothetical protein
MLFDDARQYQTLFLCTFIYTILHELIINKYNEIKENMPRFFQFFFFSSYNYLLFFTSFEFISFIINIEF